MRVNENILISSITTMKLGGVARYVLGVERPEEVSDAFDFAKLYFLPTFVLGGGANSIGHDEGFRGAIIMNLMHGISIDGTTIRAMGGETWDNVVQFACDHNLTGIEALSKIPGTAGAAPVQNIGAYGQDISQVLKNVEVYDTYDRTYKILSKDELQFSYRRSILNTTARGCYFVIAISLELKEGQMKRPFYNSIEQYIEMHNVKNFSPAAVRQIVTAIRTDKLPDPRVIPSAGSFFKNVYLTDQEADIAEGKGYPVHRGADGNKINSGWLIQQCGFAGKLLHGFRVNEKAALVLMNESGKSYGDLAAARDEIVGKVYDKFGYWIEQEPVEITE